MTKYTAQEREDAKHEMWLMTGGAEDSTEKHRKLAEESISGELADAGWSVLRKTLIKPWMEDVRVLELVVERGDVLKKLKWHRFNHGWMEKMESGGWGKFFLNI